MKKFIWLLFSLFISVSVMAEPSGEDLLKACETSLKDGFSGSTGMMCTWYATPCDCHFGKNENIPRVCLPENLEIEFLAKQVINGLKLNTELQSESAEYSANKILVEKYPCD